MEPKLVTVELINNHPKLMRLPSVSRSLYFSIMPKSCYDMYEKPVILSINPKTTQYSNPPCLSSYRKSRTKRKVSYEPRPMTRPSANSYVYNKMFHPKPSELPPKLPKKPSRSRPNTTPNQRLVTFYCEVNPPRSAPKRPDMPRSLNHTLIELGDIEAYGRPYQKNPYGGKLMVDKEMGIDMNFSQESIEDDLHKISEVHSSMEFSVSGETDQRAKSYSHIKKRNSSAKPNK